jgi:hypothetical protein
LFNFSITPQYSTSKIALIIALQAGVYGAYDNYAISYKLRRGTTTSGTLVQYNRYGMYQGGGTSTNRELFVSNSFIALDSPATTSAQSYCFTVANIDGAPGYYVNNGGVTNILMMEIAA